MASVQATLDEIVRCYSLCYEALQWLPTKLAYLNLFYLRMTQGIIIMGINSIKKLFKVVSVLLFHYFKSYEYRYIFDAHIESITKFSSVSYILLIWIKHNITILYYNNIYLCIKKIHYVFSCMCLKYVLHIFPAHQICLTSSCTSHPQA